VRYTVSVLLALVLIGVAVGRAHPAGQICAEAEALRRAGKSPGEALSKQATKDLGALLKNGSPTCAIEALAEEKGKVSSHHNVPASLSGVNSSRARLTNLGLDTTDWVVLAVGVLLLGRALLTLVISRRPGAVNLGTVTDSESKDPADTAIAAQIHQRLASQRLFGAPLVPGGGLPQTAATTLTESEVPNAKWLAALVRVLPDLMPKSGVTVDAVMRKRKHGSCPEGCTVTLSDLATGRVLEVFTAWQKTALEAADDAAIYAIAHVLQRDPIRRRTPAWSRFGLRSRLALAAMVRGNDCASEDVKAAREQYARALALDPGNLVIAMKLGSAFELPAPIAPAMQESDNERIAYLVAALKTYLRASEIWPDAYAPRYRAAVALTACADRGATAPELKLLGFEDEMACHEEAKELLQKLVDELRPTQVAKHWLETFYKSPRRNSGTRKYFQRFVNPFSIARLRVRTTYKMSVLVADKTPGETEKRTRAVEKLLCDSSPASFTLCTRLAVNWQVRYNAACYFARLATSNTDNEPLSRANALLKKVLSDPNHQVTGKWLRGDPDLEYLRKWPGGGERHDVNVIEQVLGSESVVDSHAAQA
jgi:hypothetical protein